MRPLYQPIALKVVGGCRVRAHIQGFDGGGEGVAGKLQATVGDEVSLNAEPADPFGSEGIGDGGRVDGGEQDGFQPPGKPVAAGHQIATTVAFRQGA